MSLTQQDVDDTIVNNYAIISPDNLNLEFVSSRADLVDDLFKTPHADHLVHDPLNEDYLLISGDARNDPITYVHYMYGHHYVTITRHICKCNSIPDI